MVASEKPEEMRSREIGRTLVNKGNWNYLQGWNKDESHFPCVWLPWWPAHLGHIPFHLVTFYRQPAACILKISITSEQLFLQQQSQEFPEASLSHAHLMRVRLETAGSSSCCVFKGWARPERSELHGRNKAVYKPPRQGRLKEWQQRRNVAPEPCSLLCLDLICWMWENHFNNFVPQCSDLTCLDNVIHQPQDRAAERNCCKELCIQPWAAPTGRRAASPTPPWQRTSQEGTSHSYCEATPTSTTNTRAWAGTFTLKQNVKEGLFTKEAWSCTSLWTPETWQLQLRTSGITEQVYKTGKTALSSLCAQYVFFYCSKHILPLVGNEKKKNKLTFFEQILAFVHIKGQEKGTKMPCKRKRTYLYLWAVTQQEPAGKSPLGTGCLPFAKNFNPNTGYLSNISMHVIFVSPN